MDMIVALSVIMASQVYISLQTPQVVYLKYLQLFVCRSYLNKTIFTEQKGKWSHQLIRVRPQGLSLEDLEMFLMASDGH